MKKIEEQHRLEFEDKARIVVKVPGVYTFWGNLPIIVKVLPSVEPPQRPLRWPFLPVMTRVFASLWSLKKIAKDLTFKTQSTRERIDGPTISRGLSRS